MIADYYREAFRSCEWCSKNPAATGDVLCRGCIRFRVWELPAPESSPRPVDREIYERLKKRLDTPA